MALANIAKFDWEKILSKVSTNDSKKVLNLLRNRANEVLTASGKYAAAPEKVDFAGYKQKLRFGASAVDKLEAAYNNKKLPTYYATVPELKLKQREVILGTLSELVAATKADLADLNNQIQEFDKVKFTRETTNVDIEKRFPEVVRKADEIVEESRSFKL